MEKILIGLFGCAAVLLVGAALFFGGDTEAKADSGTARASAPAEYKEPASGEDGLPGIVPANAPELSKVLKSAEGSVVVVNMWATWCPPCVAEMPELAEFYTKWKDEGVTFISLNAEGYDSLDEKIKPFQKDQALPFPLYVLKDAEIEKVEKSLKTFISGSLPTTILYDPNGKFVQIKEGAVTLKELESWIAPHLKLVAPPA